MKPKLSTDIKRLYEFERGSVRSMRQAKGMRKISFPDILNTLKTLHFQTPYQNAGVQSFGDKGEREKEIGEKTPFIGTAVVNSFCQKTAQLLAFWAIMN